MFTHSRELTIEWGQCDPAGIVYYPRYFEMFDRSTALLLETALGMNKARMIGHYAILGIPMVDTRAVFKRPATFGDVVTIRSRVAVAKVSSFEIVHRLTKDDELVVEGFETRVWVERHPASTSRIRAKAIPDDVLDRLRDGPGETP